MVEFIHPDVDFTLLLRLYVHIQEVLRSIMFTLHVSICRVPADRQFWLRILGQRQEEQRGFVPCRFCGTHLTRLMAWVDSVVEDKARHNWLGIRGCA
jgi:hypothetical protein